ncbi:hypothetical protein BGZ76_008887 [Entomortierella beljakovae]|nr:hypothetical protein BGZ76_008887 [Entomortierella beljakovae]
MFSPTRAKVQLKLSVNRLQMLQNKRNMIAQNQRKEIARLLEIGKEESARIRVEHIIREDFSTEALEILELYCELLLARFGLLEQMKNCDPAIAEAVNTIIYAAPRSEVKELSLVRDQLAAKFGRDFVSNALENKDESVNPRVIQKLQVQTPDPYLVNRYLEEIAKAFKVNWSADPETEHQLIGTQSMDVDRLDLLGDLSTLQDPPSKTPAKQSSSNQSSTNTIPKNNTSSNTSSTADDGLPDLDALTKRFQALKERK